jgi:hypothetical protein
LAVEVDNTKGSRNCARSVDQCADQAVVHVKQAFVLAKVAHVVAFVEHAPDLRAKSERVRQGLEDDVTIACAITFAPQRRSAAAPQRRSAAAPLGRGHVRRYRPDQSGFPVKVARWTHP